MNAISLPRRRALKMAGGAVVASAGFLSPTIRASGPSFSVVCRSTMPSGFYAATGKKFRPPMVTGRDTNFTTLAQAKDAYDHLRESDYQRQLRRNANGAVWSPVQTYSIVENSTVIGMSLVPEAKASWTGEGWYETVTVDWGGGGSEAYSVLGAIISNSESGLLTSAVVEGTIDGLTTAEFVASLGIGFWFVSAAVVGAVSFGVTYRLTEQFPEFMDSFYDYWKNAFGQSWCYSCNPPY